MSPVMDISDAFTTLTIIFSDIILWNQTHGFTLFGTFYSFFNIEIAALIAGFVLTHLPVWGDTKFEEVDSDE